jgi:hypothetical protein
MAAKVATRSRDTTASPLRSDAYVGMLALALIAQIVGAVFLWLDYKDYEPKKPQIPQDRPVSSATTRPPDVPVDKDKGAADKDKDKGKAGM